MPSRNAASAAVNSPCATSTLPMRSRRDGEVALPAGVARVLARRVCCDVHAVAKRRESRVNSPCATSTSPILFVGDGEVALPAGVARVLARRVCCGCPCRRETRRAPGSTRPAPPARRRCVRGRPRGRAASRRCRGLGGEFAGDVHAVAKRREGLAQFALRHQHVADLAVGDGEVALPAGVVGVLARRVSRAIAMTVAKRGESGGQLALVTSTSPILMWETERSRCQSGVFRRQR